VTRALRRGQAVTHAASARPPRAITPQALIRAARELRRCGRPYFAPNLVELAGMVHDGHHNPVQLHQDLVRLASFVACTEGPQSVLAQALVVATS
jgi:hypothetical protein